MKIWISALALMTGSAAYAAPVEYSDDQVIAMTKPYDLGCARGVAPEVTKLDYKYTPDWQSEDRRVRPTTVIARYYIATCTVAAPNQRSLLLRVNKTTGSLEVAPLSVPFIKGKSTIVGWSSAVVVDGLTYDPAKNILKSVNKSSAVEWYETIYELHETSVVLRKHIKLELSESGKPVEQVIYKSEEPLLGAY